MAQSDLRKTNEIMWLPPVNTQLGYNKIVVKKHNSTYIHITAEHSTLREIYDYFSFFAPNYQYHPKFRNRFWDGKIHLFNINKGLLYYGLVDELKKFAKENNYEVISDSSIVNVNLDEIIQFIKSLNLPFTLHEHQLQAFITCLKYRRLLILSPTGSGKSLIMYLLTRYFERTHKILTTVHTTGLVKQLASNYEEYGWSEENFHCVTAGVEKQSPVNTMISTWQSVYTQKPKYFHQFDMLIGDEVHTYDAKSLTNIAQNMINADTRFGFTGTLNESKTHELTLKGLFGKVHEAATHTELVDKGINAKTDIKVIVLKYANEKCKELVKIKKQQQDKSYKLESDYVIIDDKRNELIATLALSLKGNTLIVFRYVEKHGKPLFELIQEQNKDLSLYYISMETKPNEREKIRNSIKQHNDSITVASAGTFSTGIDIPNINNLILAHPFKSKIKVIQTIGRSLRVAEGKNKAVIFDLIDDLSIGKKKNHLLQHGLERLRYYDEHGYNYSTSEVSYDR